MSILSGILSGVAKVGSAVAPLIPGVGTVGKIALDAGLGAIGGLAENKQNMSNKMKLAAYQAQLERQQFDYAAEYNSPVNQMARLKEAGLNPNLVYGNGSAVNTMSAPSAGSSGSAPELDLDSAINSGMEVASKAINLKSAEQGIKNQKADENLKLEQVKTEQEKQNYYRAEARKLNTDASIGDVNLEVLEATKHALKQAPYLQNNLTQAQINKTNADISYIVERTSMTREETNVLTNNILLIQARIHRLAVENDLTYQQMATEVARRFMYNSVGQLNLSNKSKVDQEVNYGLVQSIIGLNNARALDIPIRRQLDYDKFEFDKNIRFPWQQKMDKANLWIKGAQEFRQWLYKGVEVAAYALPLIL